ncbi:MAG: STAS domain-containing protein [Pseudomonadales bacterium]|nr:STAS domain-containing protein [Pseudomonadales bacterium]MBO7004295.1 STAS domain-containing protein [Pseudomonadales bacterium]
MADDDIQSTIDTTRSLLSEISEDKQTLLDLPADLTIPEVGRIKKEWEMLVEESEHLVIDARNVEQIDTAGIQLLLAYIKECQPSGGRVSLEPQPSETFIAVAETLGANILLDLE